MTEASLIAVDAPGSLGYDGCSARHSTSSENVNWPRFLQRASSGRSIMSNPRNSSDVLRVVNFMRFDSLASVEQ